VLPVFFSQFYTYLWYRVGSTASCSVSKGPLRLIRFLSAFFSAWFAFLLLNRRRHGPRNFDTNSSQRPLGQQGLSHSTNRDTEEQSVSNLAGRTLDLTLYAVTRALDAIASMAWDWQQRRVGVQGRWALTGRLAPRLADAGVFAVSAAMVMWAWFYLPERLPRSYEKWIGEAANIDHRLIEALRLARGGDYVYGKDTGQASLLGSMCEDYNWPVEWGDPAQTIPIPCEMVHMGHGPSCEWHAVLRFMQTFNFAWMTYLPLQILLRVRTKQPRATLVRATKDVARSSAFIAFFVSTFYYSVCLVRTRLGPRLFDERTVTPMMWDSGLCVGAGCFVCGWSIFVESPSRRQELALFVAPRAVATLLPRRYHRQVRIGNKNVECNLVPPFRPEFAGGLRIKAIVTCSLIMN
jgi:hypothetical protein